MEIDKTIGIFDYKNSTDEDDIAFYLYCQSNDSADTFNQDFFCRLRKVKNPIVDKYYKECKLILRMQKIEKIKNGLK